MKFSVYDIDHVRWNSTVVRGEGNSEVGGLEAITPAFRGQPEQVGMFWEVGDEKRSQTVHINLNAEEAQTLHRKLGEILERWMTPTENTP